MLSVEQQLFLPLGGTRVTGVHRRQESMASCQCAARHETHNIPIPNLDPGPDGVLGTPDDTETSSRIRLSGLPRRPGFQQPWLVNDDTANSSFNTFEFQVARRYAELAVPRLV